MKRIFVIFVFAFAIVNKALAYDFRVYYNSYSLYFEIVTDGVKIVPERSTSPYYNTFPNGASIPEYVTNGGHRYNVVEIGANAFNGARISSITIPKYVKRIGANAFKGCALNTVNFNPQNCTTVASSAFPNIDVLNIGEEVTNIPDYTFYDCSNLDSVVIPNSVLSIGSFAFKGCSGLSAFIIGDSVASIGESAFEGCTSLNSISIPNSVLTIGNSAFLNCTNLSLLTIGNSVTNISNSTFKGCVSLLSVSIPNSVSTIEISAFEGCSNLSSLLIGDYVTSIENSAFEGCSSLSSIEIPNSVLSIGNSTFEGCSNLSSLTIGVSVASIGNSAFVGCSSLTSVIIPESVTDIGSLTFGDCTSLSSLTLGSSVVNVGSSAFSNCTELSSVFYNGSIIGWCNIGFADIMSNPIYYAHNLFVNNTLVTELDIPEQVSEIKQYAFAKALCLESLHISSNITTIGEYAFYGCDRLNECYFNASNCTTMGTADKPVFYECFSLMTLNIGSNVTNIPANAFSNCSGLTSVTIPDSVNRIGNSAFYNCSGLVSVYFNAANCTRMGSNDYPVFQGCTSLATLNIGNNVTTIPNYAFSSCRGLTSVSIGNSVTSIGSSAFGGCSGLEEITIPFVGGSITTTEASASTLFGYIFGTSNYDGGIAVRQYYNNNDNATYYIPSRLRSVVVTGGNLLYGAFYGCSRLTSVTIPSSVTTIDASAFYNCRGLTSVTIHNSVTNIGNFAFFNCIGISGLLSIPNSVEAIGESAFSGCSGIDSLYIGSSVETIGDNAFVDCPVSYLHYNARNCTSWLNYNSNSPFNPFRSTLQTLVLGENVESLPDYAFYDYDVLSSLSLSNSLVSIGSNAFADCDNLLSLDTRNVVSVGDFAFANCDRLVQVNIGDSARTIGNGAFEGCFRMSSANIGKSVQTIGNNAFSGCIRLVSPALPETLTSIGASAFNGCSRFEGMLTLPRNLAQIGDSAYWGCSGITAITAKPTNPPIISENTFNGISNYVPVYVPCGRVLNYYVTDYWENFPNIQEATPFEVSLSSNDNAMGVAVVTQQPTCNNHQCHIRANANYGYHFLKWTDGNESNPRILELDSDTAFMAIFVVNNSYISVQCNDSTMGSVSGSGLYSYNAPVEMRATPYTNYHFQRWHDGVTDNPRYLLATQDSTFTAVFMPNVSTVTLSNNNPEMGTVSGGGVYYYQNQISISATANYGYHFTSWHDGNTANPRMITVTQDTAFTANFAVNIYAVSATSNNNTMGSVSGGGNYNYQSLVALTATPAYGYHFEQWNDGLSNNPRTINVIQDTMFMAQFAANTYSITVQANDPRMGSAYGTGNFSYNTTTTLSATATYGYHFVQWSDGNTENPRTVPVTQNAIYTAIFEINTYAISVGSSNPAIGSAAGGGTYSYNTIVNISATPNYGYHFVQWSDGNTENPRTITVIQNATYTAQFSINSYAVSVSPNNSSRGTVSGSGSYTYNTVATISASAFYGYHFVQWSDGNTENPRSLVVMQDENYTAQFDANNYLLTANSTDVTLGNVTGGGTYEYNSLVAITANAIEHYHFVQWNDSITDNPRTIVLTRDTTFTASFAIDKHSVATTSNNPTMGEATGSGEFDYNSATYISAEAFTGYHFVQWSDGATANPRRIIVTQDTIFTAEFEVNGYTATITSNDETMGTVTGSGFYDYRTTLNLSATAFYGYHFARWNDGNSDNPRTLVITQDTALTAIFEISSFTITVEAENAQMGSVSGSGNYNYLSQATIIATAATNYHFEQWSDGSTTNPRLINVTSDSVFVAQFAENPTFTITALSADTARGMVYGGGVYHTGERASLVASPHEHYYFSHWADGSTQNPRTITVLSDATYTAYFAPYTYIITANSNNPAMGGVSGGGAYAYGETATLTARAYEGYHFVRWDDGNANATREVLVQSDESYMAIFAQGNDENGIDEVHYADLKVYSSDGQIVVECSETLPVYVYDIVGRHIYSATVIADEPLRINVPNTGVYVVKVGEMKAEKVAVW